MNDLESTKAKSKDKASFEKEDYKYGFHDAEQFIFKAERGLTEEIVRNISKIKNEPQWMTDFRVESYRIFLEKPMPNWGDVKGLNSIDFESIYYYLKPTGGQERSWDDVPEDIKNTFEKLGIPEAEQKFLGGVTAQYESEVVYHSIREDLEKLGVIFTDMDTALREHSDIVKKYFSTIIPPSDNKFAALNSAVWSGGSFIYVPPDTDVAIPLQAYFRINAKNMGQFERTLIITDKNSKVHYIEGCTAPTYSTDSLHSAVVELIAMEGSTIRYSTIQNWSNNVYNLVTKRAVAYENARVEWVDGNIGSKVTMKYPAVYLKGRGAHGEVLSIAYAGKGQHQDAGAKIVHAAPDTTSSILSKSLTKDGGQSTYRGLIKVYKDSINSKSSVKCDALMLDNKSTSLTLPYMEIEEERGVRVQHEATVSKVDDDMLFFMTSRGISEDDAKGMVINGFIEPFTRELPMEYAVELNRLIQLEMQGAIG
ncbi:MAG: Fe-S cluster assembly protein SufB [Spirochaetia bacterium]|nr:Fe-S cluster assembly protein SufB [Spirochaetia bacterium]